VRDDRDINALLPVLSTYMGHKTLMSTTHYLRLTADVFPEVTTMLESHFGSMIPHWGGVN
jgi:hypothetical protein